MRRYRILIIGTGRIASVHAASVHRHPLLELSGFVNSLEPGELPRQWSVPCYVTLEEALEASPADGLVIASPTATHLHYLRAAVRHALPTLCEKPIALDRRSVEEAVDMVARSNVPVMLGFHRRFDPHRREVRARIAAGEIGKLEHILQLSRDPRLPDPMVMAHQGGIVADMVIHDLDELLWLTGRAPHHIQARLDRFVDPALAEIGDHDSVSLQLEWEGGPVAHVSATRRARHHFEQRLEVFGSEGRLICTDPRTSAVVVDGAGGTVLAPRHDGFADRYREAYQAEIDHLAELIRGMSAPICGIEDGLRAFDLVDRVEVASREPRRPVGSAAAGAPTDHR